MPLKARVEQLFVGGGGGGGGVGCVYTLPVVRLISMARWRWPRTLNWGRETSLLTPTLFGPSFHLYRMSLIVYPTEKIERPPAVGTYLRGSPQRHFSSERASTYLAPPSNLTSPLSLSFTFSPFSFVTIFFGSFLSFYLSVSLSIYLTLCPSQREMSSRRELSRAQIKLILKEHVGGISGVWWERSWPIFSIVGLRSRSGRRVLSVFTSPSCWIIVLMLWMVDVRPQVDVILFLKSISD